MIEICFFLYLQFLSPLLYLPWGICHTFWQMCLHFRVLLGKCVSSVYVCVCVCGGGGGSISQSVPPRGDPWTAGETD